MGFFEDLRELRDVTTRSVEVSGGVYSDPSGAKDGGAGGSGIVLVKIPSAKACSVSVAPGCNTLSCGPSGSKIATFTVSGTLTVS